MFPLFCSCSYEEVREPVEDTTLKLNHSLNLASDISVNLLVPATLLEGFNMDTVYVESTIETSEGNTLTGTMDIRTEPVQNGSYGNNKIGNLLDLCKALFAYSDSAYSYFR